MDRDLVWSVDQETYNYDSLDELLDAEYGNSDWLTVGATVYCGEKDQVTYKFVDADDVIEMIGERAYDVGGEWAEYHPNCTPEQKQELEDFLDKWQSQFKPTFYLVNKSKEYILTSEDLEGYVDE